MRYKIHILQFNKNKRSDKHKLVFYIIFILLFIIGIALRLLAIKYEDTISSDSIDYINLSKRIIQENDFSLIYNDEKAKMHPPLIYIVMYLLKYSETRYLFNAMQTLSFILGVLIPIILLFSVFIKTHSKEAALSVMAIAEVHPFFIRMSYEVLRDPFYLFFTSLFFLSFALMTKRGEKTNLIYVYAFLCGATGLFAFLSRIEGLELLALYLLFLIYRFIQINSDSNVNKRKEFHFLFRGAACFVIGYAIVFIVINTLFGIKFSFYSNMLFTRLGYHISQFTDSF